MQAINNIYKVEKNDTIELSYELIDYNLKVYGNDKLLLEKTVNYGDDVNALLESITKYNEDKGYQFMGFDNESDIILGDTIINCVYDKKSYTITIKDNDEILEEFVVKHGDSVDLSKYSYSKDGYTFDGLSLNGKKISSIDSVNSDLVINAEFSVIVSKTGCNSSAIIYLSFMFILVLVIRKRY